MNKSTLIETGFKPNSIGDKTTQLRVARALMARSKAGVDTTGEEVKKITATIARRLRRRPGGGFA